MRVRESGFRTMVLTAVLLMVVLFVVPVHADASSAQLAINSAQLKLIECYNSAKAAESATANISQLTPILNEAGMLFSHAQLAFTNGDFDGAQNYATQTQSLLENFVSQANALEGSAAQSRDQSFLFGFVGSIVGTILVLVISSVLWILLKRRYGDKEEVKS